MTDGRGAEPAELVFVGGTGRSGTHILGRLLGSHARFADVPIEARFHCNKRGMPDLLSGRVSLGGFMEKLRWFWWHRVRVDDQPRGLYNLMSRPRFDAAAERFERTYHDEPVSACAALCRDLLWSACSEQGKPALVEMSSHNIKEAQTLRRLFPAARFVHTVRDGRDAASSVATKTWGPSRTVPAIAWWADRLRAIDAGLRGEEDGGVFVLGPDRLHTLVLDDLVGGDREPAFAALLDFCGVAEDEGARAFFDGHMSAGQAHRGRWTEGVGPVERARVRRRYERTLAALAEERNHVAAPLLDAYERLG
ncbi:MAG: sulfotransferase family protein [Solirubrobacterales bacterium]